MKRKLSLLFKNLCCSICKHEFDEDSFVIKRDEQGLLVTTLQCQNCGKNYGVAFLGFSDINVKDTSILEALNSKLFTSLRDGDLLMDDHEGGCVLFEHKDDVERILIEQLRR